MYRMGRPVLAAENMCVMKVRYVLPKEHSIYVDAKDIEKDIQDKLDNTTVTTPCVPIRSLITTEFITGRPGRVRW